MKVIKETIGDATVFIQAMEDDLEIVGEVQNGPDTVETISSDDVRATYASVKAVITGIAEDIGAELKQINDTARPKQVEMEFNVGISAQVGPVWILSGKGEYGLKVKMMWELESDEYFP